MKTGDNWKNWTVGEKLGEGSFGKVFRIYRTEYDMTYESALKVIRIPQNSSEVASIQSEGMDDESVRAYYQSMVDEISSECALMYKLRGHSNIVSYEGHSVEELKDEFGWEIFIQMELLTPLSKHIRQHGMATSDAVRLGIDICKALEVCSSYGIIHRDIKPENVFVSPQGDFKLGDFGIARRFEKTSGMSRKGTSNYMAPEVYKSQPYNACADIYSLGIMLYRLTNGNRLPFLPPYPQQISYYDNENAFARRMNGEDIPVPEKAGDLFGKIILTACAYRAEDRYQSAEELRKALETVENSLRTGEIENEILSQQIGQEDETLTMDPDSTVTMFDGDLETLTMAQTFEGSGKKSVSGRRGVKRLPLIAAAILILAAIAGAAVYIMQSGPEEVSAGSLRLTDKISTEVKATFISSFTGGSAEEYQYALPGSDKNIVFVNNTDELTTSVSEAEAGTLIVLNSGEYELDRPLLLRKSIHLHGLNSDKPLIKGTLYVASSGVVIDNLRIKAYGPNMNDSYAAIEAQYDEELYLRDLDISYEVTSENIHRGVSASGSVYVENCSIKVLNDSGGIGIGSSLEGLRMTGCSITATDSGVEVPSEASGYEELSDEEKAKVDEIANSNTISADDIVSGYTTSNGGIPSKLK